MSNEQLNFEQRPARAQTVIGGAGDGGDHVLSGIQRAFDEANRIHGIAAEQLEQYKEAIAQLSGGGDVLEGDLVAARRRLEAEVLAYHGALTNLIKSYGGTQAGDRSAMPSNDSMPADPEVLIGTAERSGGMSRQKTHMHSEKKADNQEGSANAVNPVENTHQGLIAIEAVNTDNSNSKDLARFGGAVMEHGKSAQIDVSSVDKSLPGDAVEKLLEKLKVLLEEREQLSAQSKTLADALAESERCKSELTQTLEAERQSFQAQTSALEASNADRAEVAALQTQKIDALAADVARLQESLSEMKAERDQLRAQRQQLGSTISLLEAEMKARANQVELAKVDAVRHKMALVEANSRVQALRNEVVLANRQVERTKQTLSFQLGHALIFGTKSFRDFRSLPQKLWAIHQLAKQRRQERGENDLVFEGGGRRMPQAQSKVSEEAQRAAEEARARLQGLHDNSGEQLKMRLKTLKVASIMDEFTYGSYQEECNLLQLTPANWEHELSTFQPELLFIESAWRGKDELWGSKVGHLSSEVVGILNWCRSNKVPTIFWNKEDPVHFGTFLSTAKQFDFVFTTDIDCIHRYKAALGHDRIYLLPFAAQPKTHNPIEKYDRKDAFCFAGSYYTRYPDRIRDLASFVVNFPEFKPVEIFDRNFGKNDPNYSFPEEYRPFIVGNLPYTEIDKAYKGYRYAINLNSIKQSQSMFARRVYELLASNTVTVSNFSRGVRLMFSDLVLTSDSGEEIKKRLLSLMADDLNSRKFRLIGMRKVMSEHTYQDRLAYIVGKISGEVQPSLLPTIFVVAYAKSRAQAEVIYAAFSRQKYANKKLILVVADGFAFESQSEDCLVQVFSLTDAMNLSIGDLGSPMAWVAVMVPDDYYGESYLTDLALSTRYAGDVVGKFSYYVWSSNAGLSIQNSGQSYRRVATVPARSGMSRLDRFVGISLRDFVRELYTLEFKSDNGHSIDEFNYCRSGAMMPESAQFTVCDLQGLDEGVPIGVMLDRAEKIRPEEVKNESLPQISSAELAELFSKPPAKTGLTVTEKNGVMHIDSILSDDEKEYRYASRYLNAQQIGVSEGRIRFHLELKPGLNVQLAILFFDEAKQRIGNVVKPANANHDVEVPQEATYFRLGLRVSGGGSASVSSLLLAHRVSQPAEVFGRAENLIVTNHYPSYDDLYRNGFVHSRVRSYQERGVKCDVFRFRLGKSATYHEFEGVDVTTGGEDVLRSALQSGQYRNIFVHVLDETKWSILAEYADRLNIVVWAHGAEIQAYHRREFMYNTDEQRNAAISRGEKRVAFWQKVLGDMPKSLRMVFVSHYLADTVMDDLGMRLPEDRYAVIHNPIDTVKFNYVKKDASQRLRVLSIRPYASSVYANDLSVKAIMALSHEPFFNEMEFRIIGDGPLFEETISSLRQFKNIIIEQRFLTQNEISLLHKEYGIFLCPTRMDTQGVSRDEAMSSGLVAVTNSVAAVPEFVDESCAVLAPAEDATGLANGIKKLVNDPILFQQMSAAAAERVRVLSASEIVISQELNLLA